jgi:hypothetical protein
MSDDGAAILWALNQSYQPEMGAGIDTRGLRTLSCNILAKEPSRSKCIFFKCNETCITVECVFPDLYVIQAAEYEIDFAVGVPSLDRTQICDLASYVECSQCDVSPRRLIS